VPSRESISIEVLDAGFQKEWFKTKYPVLGFEEVPEKETEGKRRRPWQTVRGLSY
jgi:hypothetical protein